MFGGCNVWRWIVGLCEREFFFLFWVFCECVFLYWILGFEGDGCEIEVVGGGCCGVFDSCSKLIYEFVIFYVF